MNREIKQIYCRVLTYRWKIGQSFWQRFIGKITGKYGVAISDLAEYRVSGSAFYENYKATVVLSNSIVKCTSETRRVSPFWDFMIGV